ncbi:MAG: tRNA (adenosine(37)-N6)-threonylcarbamoyltransferase complex ATPase subunit type 1 TsaE [Clostridia bacterium]|nr:tRNA (adenosine(37)-N6)-threonylcarbamoyltransferase complex ATPase subunit type 1 TsaE [Clostridia bacterium]
MKEIFSVITKDESQTMLIGEKIAGTIEKGSVITLVGDLGAGKTHFVKGFAKGMNCTNLVTSPTFTLLNVYDNGKMPIYHFDMYRLSSLEEAEELGFNEYFDLSTLDGVSIVEWPQQVEGLINVTHYQVEIQKIDESQRKITVSIVEVAK